MSRSEKGHSCFECGLKAKHAHHVIPYSKGGRRTIPLCEKCHSLVHDMDLVKHSELVKAGMERARKEGRWPGPPKYKIDLAKVKMLRDKGLEWREVGEILGVNWETIRTRIKRQGAA